MNQRLFVDENQSKKLEKPKYYSYANYTNKRLFICDSSKGKSVSHSVKLNKNVCFSLDTSNMNSNSTAFFSSLKSFNMLCISFCVSYYFHYKFNIFFLLTL